MPTQKQAILIHRRIIESHVFSNPNILKVWIWCLSKATFKKREVVLGYIKINLKPGQFIYGRNSAGKELNMSPSTVRNCIEYLIKDRSLDRKATSKYSVITVLNWDTYQESGQVEGQQRNSNVTASKQQRNTNKNVKNVKNDKKIWENRGAIGGAIRGGNAKERKGKERKRERDAKKYFYKEVSEEFINDMLSKHPHLSSIIHNETEKAYDWLLSEGATKKDYRAFFRNWLRRATSVKK